MSLWTRISAALSALSQGEPLSQVFSHLRSAPEKRAGFAIAVIALGAKMAKADGRVTRDEVTAFREVFTIPPDQEKNAARLFNLARQDVAGFEIYARQIRALFGTGSETLCDLLEGLFHIAMADGEYHPGEDAFLTTVAQEFSIPDRTFQQMRARFVPEAERDPYDVLGVSPQDDLATIRAAWRSAVRESHPDRLHARGLPREAITLAEARLVAVNRAWGQINKGAS